MNKYTMFTKFFLSFFIITKIFAGSQLDTNDIIKNFKPTLLIKNLDINDKRLELSYEIVNNTNQEIWILFGPDEIFLEQDNQTIVLRDRLDLRIMVSIHNVNGIYVLLKAGETRKESITIPLPVYEQTLFDTERKDRYPQHANASRLVLEIGYYIGDLPTLMKDIFTEAEETRKNLNIYDEDWLSLSRQLLRYNRENEILKDRDEEVWIPYTNQKLKFEQNLRTIIAENLNIPFDGTNGFFVEPDSLNIALCSKIEVQFQPSMLEFYFPFEGQRNLFNQDEYKYLESIKTIVVEDQEKIKDFVNNINKGQPSVGIVRQRSIAHIMLYNENKLSTSFDISNNTESVIEGGIGSFDYIGSDPGLEKLTPEIIPFEYRTQCAGNLKNLWYRILMFQHYATPMRTGFLKLRKIQPYPSSTNWCDSLAKLCVTIDMTDKEINAPFICPSAQVGKSHYAMNPNCKPDSPKDMVLLFETKAGWNQNGGPELFTFDNHDPKGGSVLLNDGTVKFIRTEEELNQLRWK
jgi:hypothetical protein